MVILPPRRDSEKDSLANYTPGAAVEKIYIYQCISVFLRCFFFFFLYTHTPLNGIRAGFPTEPSLVLKIKSFSAFFLSIQSAVGIELDLPNWWQKGKKTFLSLLPMLHHLSTPLPS